MPNWLTQNWSLKLLALVIGLSLWVFVVGQEKSEINLRMPVELRNVPQNMMVTGKVARAVNVLVRGPRSLIRTTAFETPVKTLDLSRSEVGENTFQVVPEDLQLPPGLSVISISPALLRVTMVKATRLTLPVRPILEGQPAEGLEVGEVSFKPDKVRVSGPEGELGDLEWVWTVPIKIDGLKESKTIQVMLRRPPGQARLEPAEVQARIKIVPARDKKPPAQAKPAPPAKTDR